MAVEGIHVAREIRDGNHLLHSQQTPISPLAGGGGGSEWDDSMWSLSCTESEDQSSETNAPISGTPRSFPSEAPSSMESKVVLRRQPGLSRRHMQKAKTLGCYPPLTAPLSPSPSPNSTTKRLTSYGIPVAIGLDCYELRRRSRNAEISTKWSSHAPREDSVAEPTAKVDLKVNPESHHRYRREAVRRIQSLNRYSNCHTDREACQMSWENLKTKPPRPPTTSHSSNTASPPRMISSESEGGIQSSPQDSQQTAMPTPINFGTIQTTYSRGRIISSPIRQGSVPDTSQSGSNLPPKMSPQLLSSDLCEGPVPMRIQQTRAPLTNQGQASGPEEVPILQVPVMPVAMVVQTSPVPARIVDEPTVRSSQSRQKQRRMPALQLSQGSTITLYGIMQFSSICTTYIPPLSPNDPLRRNSWEIGELIPGLGIRVSVVSVTYSSSIRPPQMWNEISGLREIHHTPGSAFTPVTSGSSPNVLAEPLLIVIDDTSVAGRMYFQPGQIILEVNGVNFFSVPVTSKQGLLTRLIATVFNAYNNGDGSLFLTLATPYPHLVSRIANETMEIQLNEQ
ncbi:unnamed protein product [Hymenolepis diminuta]|uniref:PDZ domain-containing protein n=2 Tax=Hymenolepis diminuta TaxID=6216 RepID=A0A0R3SQC3_HYMDI|nr:unnamed protein product [Hymenolepis diminuta]VUZ40840.1 unnamed protein product [Hymenolepis diminuta]